MVIALQNGFSAELTLQAGPRIGMVLLLSVAGLSGIGAWNGQQLLQRRHPPLTPEVSQTHLWRTFRWAIDPQQRREAALLMQASDGSSDLLRGQGWGGNPLAAVAIEQEAVAAENQGQHSQATSLWRQLLSRFPQAPGSAWARLALVEDQPVLREQLLAQFPTHPAALTLAAQLDASESERRQGALHLARWGVRWPGSLQAMRTACAKADGAGLKPEQRQLLARSLATLGDGPAALACLGNSTAEPDTQLAIGRSLLLYGETQQGTALLLGLTVKHPRHPASLEGARLLSEPLDPDPVVLDAIPIELAQRSAALAAARVRLAQGDKAEDVLKTWPDDPDIWQLQWDLAREAILAGRWTQARRLLNRPADLAPLPAPLEARRLFWLGLTLHELGDQPAAEDTWKRLIDGSPAGYYRWRAMDRLGMAAPLDLRDGAASEPPPGWEPLNSEHELVNTLWRLGQVQSAWDTWRAMQKPRATQPPAERLAEGRLRLSVGDTWMALDQLWWLSLRWRDPTCQQRQMLRRSQFPQLFNREMGDAAKQSQVRVELLRAIAKQESRFAPGVTSPTGAIGLMQLMPETAAEMAQESLTTTMIREPERNIRLGARYLDRLLQFWDGNPFLSIASYNAGPGAVASWPKPTGDEDPALWIERIPYPETRYYTKKVIDNLLGYADLSSSGCEPVGRGMGQSRADGDAAVDNRTEQNERRERSGNNADAG